MKKTDMTVLVVGGGAWNRHRKEAGKPEVKAVLRARQRRNRDIAECLLMRDRHRPMIPAAKDVPPTSFSSRRTIRWRWEWLTGWKKPASALAPAPRRVLEGSRSFQRADEIRHTYRGYEVFDSPETALEYITAKTNTR